MKTLFLDCGMGAAGDMLAAALLELLPDPDGFVQTLNDLGLPGVEFRREPSVKCGVTGAHLSVTVNGCEEESLDREHAHAHNHDHSHEHPHDHDHDHGHDHRHGHAHPHSHHSMADIEHIVRGHLDLPKAVADDVMAVYRRIAAAESRVHGVEVSEIHFHEVGAMDAIADIAAVCLLMHRIAPDEVVVSPIRVGFGQVRCAHGLLPVPAPATALILEGAPVYAGEIRGEMCTPTGAALLTHFADRFADMPPMRVQSIGYGMGKKDFEAANCVRAMLGESASKRDSVLELSCNVDDMTAEEIGFAMERLFDGGALDVYTLPIGMKKSRPGTLIRVMCAEDRRDEMVGLLFRHTTTLGVRESALRRHVLDRKTVTVETPCGPVRRKDASGYGVHRSKYEYEDLAAIAREQNISLSDAASLARKSDRD
ncbi:MAG: nickel pincer cofactor biosynthesis protein LarC [Candidatus Faecivicinus sp.]